ncbi:MAG: hypothetical protein IPJ34_40330 [Myxococcales bacterium]|nr:hypothetical protein [Myxococcales bacterium]
MALIETAYAAAPDERTWASGVVEATRKLFSTPAPCGFTSVRHSPDLRTLEPLVSVGAFDMPAARDQADAFAKAGPAAFRSLYFPPEDVVTHTRLMARLSPAVGAELRSLHRHYGVEDVLGVLAHPEPGVVAVLFAGATSTFELSRHELRTLRQLAVHLEAGLRLRLRPEAVRAALHPDGRVVHLAHGSPSPELLSNQVRKIEKTRTRKARHELGALDPWTALVEGSVSLVERAEGSRRIYLVVENGLRERPMRALTPSEIDVLKLSARGLSTKLVAYALGIAPPTVSLRLGSAASKLGLTSRTELVRVAALFSRDPVLREAKLSRTEEEILELVSQGYSNNEIAGLRNRSPRTIANQVARLLQKTSSSSRRSLAVLPPRRQNAS